MSHDLIYRLSRNEDHLHRLASTDRLESLLSVLKRVLREQGTRIYGAAEVHGLIPTVELGVVRRSDDKSPVVNSFLKVVREIRYNDEIPPED